MVYSINEDDIVIVSALRTAVSKAGRGNFKDLTNDMLVYYAIKGTLDAVNIDPCLIDEICLGHGLSPMNGTTALRVGALRSGIPLTVPTSTINRQCGSGLDSVEIIANKIKLGKIEIGLAGGFESMTSYNINSGKLTEKNNDSKKVKDCFMSMGMTAEILAEKHEISRLDADLYAFESHTKAFKSSELRKKEIISVCLDNKIIDFDDGVREPSLEKLNNLRPVFKENGICTAGNSSQLSDGASIVLLMKRKKAIELNFEIQGLYIDFVSVGLEPSVMGEGPVPAIKKLLKQNNLKISDIEYFEINEAFACQALYCIKELGIDKNKVNLYGGAVAIGHPIGSTGGRLIATVLNVMKNNHIKGFGIVSMCVGTGQGVAVLLKHE